VLKLKGIITYIYVDGKKFNQCKSLFVVLPEGEEEDFDYIESIDEAGDIMNEKYKRNHIKYLNSRKFGVPPETEFWGHCSNLQAWYEHKYDPRVLHSNIAFPLLKELCKLGDPIAKERFKDAVRERFLSGNTTVIKFLLADNYLDIFDEVEMESMLQELEKNATGEEENVWNALGVGFFHGKKMKSSINALEHSIWFNPLQPESWKNLAVARYKNGDELKGSLEAILKAVEIVPDDAAAWQFAAFVHKKMGNHAESVSATRKARKIQKRHPDIVANLKSIFF